jgi:hypothetical protein
MMNERILEIAKQAGIKYSSEKALSPAEIKFAQLIVAECAEFADEHNSEVEGVTLGVGKAIKQHFGVEE